MKLFHFWYLSAWVGLLILQGCASVPGRAGTAEQADGQDPYSVSSMTRFFVEIEKGLGTDQLRSKNLAYEKECRTDPHNPNKRFLYAFSLEDRSQAWAELSKVSKLQEDYYWAYLGMASISDGWGIYDQAENNYQHAIAIRPKIAIGYGRYGKMLLKTKTWQDALPYLEKAVANDPREMVYKLDLARVYRAAGRDRDAMDVYQKAIETDPDSLETLHEYASMLWKSNEREKALALFVRAAEIDPQAFEPRYQAAQILAQLGRKDQALEAYIDACARRSTDTVCWATAAELAGELNRDEQARIAYEKLLIFEPDNLAACKYLGPLYLKAGDLEKALPCFKAVYAVEKNNLDALSGLAKVYEQGGEISRAIDLYQKLLALKPDSSEAHHALERLFVQFHVLADPISAGSPEEVFSKNREQIAKVYRMLLKDRPRLAGHIHLMVTVDDVGRVEKVSVVRNTVGDMVIDVCAIWNMRRSKFPQGFGSTYNFELSLKPGT